MTRTRPRTENIVATGSIKEKEFMYPLAVVIDEAIFELNETSERERNGYVIPYTNAPTMYRMKLVIIVVCF